MSLSQSLKGPARSTAAAMAAGGEGEADQRRTRTLCVAALGSGSTDGSATGSSSTTADTTGSTTAEPPARGDGVMQAGEDCDNGNR